MIKFKIWRVTFWKSFFTVKKIWDGLPVFTQETIYHVRIEMKTQFDSLNSHVNVLLGIPF